MASDEMRERARKYRISHYSLSHDLTFADLADGDAIDGLAAEFAREELQSAAREMREVLDAQTKLIEKRSYPLTKAEKYAAGVVAGWADWLERRAKERE